MRKTRTPRIALERLASRLGTTLDQPTQGTYTVSLVDAQPLNAKRLLGRLVRVAQYPTEVGGKGLTREEVRDAIMLTQIGEHGIKGPELEEVERVLVR